MPREAEMSFIRLEIYFRLPVHVVRFTDPTLLNVAPASTALLGAAGLWLHKRDAGLALVTAKAIPALSRTEVMQSVTVGI